MLEVCIFDIYYAIKLRRNKLTYFKLLLFYILLFYSYAD